MPAATACSVSRGRATSVSSRHDRAAVDVERVEARAEVALDVGERASRRGGTKTWWYFRHSSPSHCTVSVSGATTSCARPAACGRGG